MSVKENKAVAKRWNEEIINGRRLEALGEVLAQNYAHYDPSSSSWSPDAQGLDRAKEIVEAWWAEHPEASHVSVEDIIGEGDKVAARLTGYVEGKPTSHTVVFHRFSGGKIVDDWYCHTEIQS